MSLVLVVPILSLSGNVFKSQIIYTRHLVAEEKGAIGTPMGRVLIPCCSVMESLTDCASSQICAAFAVRKGCLQILDDIISDA